MHHPISSFRRITTTLLLAVTLLGGAASAPAADDAKIEELAQKAHEARIERLWQGQWRTYAGSYFMYDGQPYLIRNYDPRRKSSLPLTEEHLRRMTLQLNWVERNAVGTLQRSKRLAPPDEDINFALSVLPRLSPGHWGYIYSVRTRRGDTAGPSIQATHVSYIDEGDLGSERRIALKAIRKDISGMASINVTAEQIVEFNFRFREQGKHLTDKPILMTGFNRPTQQQTRSEWVGPFHVVIIDRGNGLEAIPMSNIQPGLSEEQFIAMLEARGKSKEAFAAMIADALDRRLPSNQRDQALRRWLEDVEVRVAVAETEPQAEPAEPTEPSTPDKPKPTAATETKPPADEPTAVSTATARRKLDDYLDPTEKDERDPNKSIFDFGRD